MPTKRFAPIAYQRQLLDCGQGVVGGVSDYGEASPRSMRFSNNAVFRPRRSYRPRPGSIDTCSAACPYPPHSLGEWVKADGTSKVFVVVNDTGATSKVYENTGSAYTAQTLPYALTEKKAKLPQLNYALYLCQEGGSETPIMFRDNYTANTWERMKLPVPGATMTITKGTSAGGQLTLVSTYYWRLRWVFRDGSSKSSTPQTVTLTGGENKVDITTMPNSSRGDYLFWRLERTRAQGSVDGPYYFVAQGDNNSDVAHTDEAADSSLLYETDEGAHGEPPHMDGIVAYKNRIVGWAGSTLYISQAIADLEATGPCNFDADLTIPIGTDDKDVIQNCEVQADRLVILKGYNIYVLEGDGPESFRMFQLGDGYGISGSRASCVVGRQVWGYSASRGLWVMPNSTPLPVGQTEVGHYLELLTSPTEVVLWNQNADYVCMAYPVAFTYNDEMLWFDQNFRNWSHHSGWRIKDVLIRKDRSMLFADPLDLDPGGGVSYRVWRGFSGTKDGRASDGTGGTKIPVRTTTPMIDDGLPDDLKDLSRVEFYGSFATQTTVQLRFLLEPSGRSVAIPLTFTPKGTLWGAANWGAFDWATPQADRRERALPQGTYAHRWALEVSFDADSLATIGGAVVDGELMPDRDY